MKQWTKQILIAAAAAVPLMTAATGFGQVNKTWDGGGALGSIGWTDPANWDLDTIPPDPNNNQFHLFGAAGISKLTSDFNPGDQLWEYGQLQFAASNYIINTSNSSTMSMSGFNNGSFITSTAGQTGNTVNVPITLNSANTTNTAGNANKRTVDTNTGTIILNGSINADANPLRLFDVRKIGGGTLTLGAANSFSQTFESTNGITRLGNDLSLGTATIVVANGAANTVRYTSDTAATRNLANNFTVGGAGVLAFGESGTGDMTLGGTMVLGIANKPIAVLSGSTVTIGGVMSDGGAGNGFTKNNPGTLILSNVNTYTGQTTVGDGTLRISATGSVAGAVGVGGGTLEGTGTVAGALGVYDIDLVNAPVGGTLAPGTASTIGTLNGSTASFGTGGNYLYNIASPASTDLLLLTGALTASATSVNPFNITVDGTGFIDSVNQQYTLVDGTSGVVGFDPAKFTLNTAAFAPGATGTFALGLSPDTTNLVLNYTAVPEPGTLALAALAGVGLLSRRRSKRA